VKEYAASAGKVTELETERNELQVRVRTFKSELAEYSSRMTALTKIETEYTSYRREVEVKLARFTELDEDIFRLKAEIEELKMRNDRMQKRLAEKENEIKELEAAR